MKRSTGLRRFLLGTTAFYPAMLAKWNARKWEKLMHVMPPRREYGLDY